MGFSNYIGNFQNRVKPDNIGSEDWQKIIDANPYTPDKWSRDKTMWDDLAILFGFRSSMDNYIDQMQLASNTYYADAIANYHKEKYDSEIEQAQRQRAAGLNPDLLGVNGGEGQNMNEEQIKPDLTQVGDSGNAIMKGILSFVTGVMGFSKDTLSLAGIVEENATKRVVNNEKFKEFAQSFIKESVMDSNMIDDKDYLTDKKWGELRNDIMQKAKLYTKGWRKKDMERFMNNINAFLDSSKTVGETYGTWKKALQDRKDFAILAGNKYYGTGINMGDIEGLMKAVQPLSNLAMNDEFTKLGASIAEGQYNKDYYESADGTLAGEAENAENEYKKQSAEYEKLVKDAKKEVMDKLDELEKQGNKLASIGKALAPMLFQMIENNANAIRFGQRKSEKR